jgi:F-type H+-transporting ATPase subunit b
LEQAKEEAEKRRKELVQAARDEAKALRAKWKQSVEQQKDGFLKELRRRSAQEIHAAVRNALADLANEEVERHMVDVFVGRLAELEGKDKESLAESVAESDSRVMITSTFEMPEEQQSKLAEIVRQATRASVEIQFVTADDSICGIELKAGGRKLAWNFEAYVEELEETVSRLLEKETREEQAQGTDSENEDDENDEG